MKITKIKTYVVPAHVSDSDWAFGKAFVLVKVETDESLSGWGEAYVPNDCELAVAALVDALARYLEGNDVPQIAQFRHNALHSFATLQTGLHFSCAVAGIDEGLTHLRQLRESLPAECDILVDAWRALDYESAKTVLNTLEAMGIRWLEDPVPTEDFQSLARLAESGSVDIVTGETLSDEAGFSQLLNHRAADILNPDIACVGLSTITSMAASARAASCKVAIHNFNSMGPALAASLNAGAAIENLAGVEYFSRFKAGTEVFCRLNWQQTQNGSFTLSKEPGLGISVDESILTDFDYRPAAKRPWPG